MQQDQLYANGHRVRTMLLERRTGSPDIAFSSYEAEGILYLADLVPVVRRQLGLDSTFPDDAVLASLKMIAARSSPRERWRAAFDSNLGHWLGLKVTDLNSALNTLVGLLPSPRS